MYSYVYYENRGVEWRVTCYKAEQSPGWAERSFLELGWVSRRESQAQHMNWEQKCHPLK